MENCNDAGRSLMGHDLILMVFTAVGTCIAIAAYNHYVDPKLEAKEGEDGKGGGALSRLRRSLASEVHEDYHALEAAPPSLAASLARHDGTWSSGNMLSAIISQLWGHMSVAISSTIKDIVEPILVDTLPVAVHFTKLDLGKVPIKATNMFIHRVDLENEMAGLKGKQAGIQIDFDVDWVGDCDIMLRATLKPAGVNFGIRNLKLSGRMYIVLSPLTSVLPVVSAAQYGFINPPKLDLSFSGVGKVLNSLDILQKQIAPLIQSILNGVLVLPKRLVMPIDLANYDYLDMYQPPVGMVRITALEGRGFKVQRKTKTMKLVKDTPDVYCKISLGASKLFKTSTQKNTLNPHWGDSCDFILYDMEQKVYLVVKDNNTLEVGDTLGRADITARDLFRSGGRADVELELDERKLGIFVTLSAELFHLSERLGSLSSVRYGDKNQLCGLVTIIVTRAFDIPLPKGDVATSIKCVYGEGSNHKKTFSTMTVTDVPGVDALNPMYDSVFHLPLNVSMIKDGAVHSIAFTLINGQGAKGTCRRSKMGKIMVTHESLLGAYKHTITKTSLIGDVGARLEYMIRLNGVQSEEEYSEGDTNDTCTLPESPCGGITAIRVTAVRGRGFKVKKHRMRKAGVPNVYCEIRLNPCCEGKPPVLWRTATIKDDSMPQWKEFIVFSDVDPTRAIICVDAYDDRKIKNEHLGHAEFSVRMLLRKRTTELELEDKSTPTNTYITLRCVELGPGTGSRSHFRKGHF